MRDWDMRAWRDRAVADGNDPEEVVRLLIAAGNGREYPGKPGADLETGLTPCKIWKAWKP